MTNENCLTPQGLGKNFSISSPKESKSCKKSYNRIYIVMVNCIMMQMQMSIWISQEEITEYLYDNRDESFPKCILLILRFWRIYEKK